MTPRGVRERLARGGLGLGLALVLGCLVPGRSRSRSPVPPPRPSGRPERRRFIPRTALPDPVQRRAGGPVDRGGRAVRLGGLRLHLEDGQRDDPRSSLLHLPRSADAEYWFAVRTRDKDGKFYPGEDEAVEPSMKVIVDTVPPSLVLEPDGRRGSRVAVRWEVRDENLDKLSLVLEYQAEGRQ